MSQNLRRPDVADEISRTKARLTAVEKLLGRAGPVVPQPVATFSHPGVVAADESGFRTPRNYGLLWDVQGTLGVAGAVVVDVLVASPFTDVAPVPIATLTFDGSERTARQPITDVCLAADFDLVGVEVVSADGVAEDLVVEVRMGS